MGPVVFTTLVRWLDVAGCNNHHFALRPSRAGRTSTFASFDIILFLRRKEVLRCFFSIFHLLLLASFSSCSLCSFTVSVLFYTRFFICYLGTFALQERGGVVAQYGK